MSGQEKDHSMHIDDGVLTIDTMHPHHAGEYECLADNTHGTLHSTMTVEVHRTLKC